MCGIAGVFAPAGVSVSPETLRDTVAGMTGAMRHRGPDADGIWVDPRGRCALGHRRLSIIDTSDAGLQPMLSGDDRHVISYNGEIYNYLELRPELERAGVRIRGRTDTEILLEAVAHHGTAFLPRLDGQFAFGLFDRRDGSLTLARDAFGEKPLSYTVLRSGLIAFASELQALERCPGFDARVDVSAMAEVLSFQYIGAPRTIYRSVRKLLPGHWLRFDPEGRSETGRYFHFDPGQGGYSERPIADLADELEEILTASISRRMIADVPLGAFLSGGVDSSTVCALIRAKLKRPLKSFSIGFAGAPESEHLTARLFAEHLGTEHHDEILDPDISVFLREIGAKLDEPNADSSCMPTYLLSRFARQQVTVALSGDGGDELFGGYGRYFATLEEDARRKRGDGEEWWTPGGAYYGNRILVASEPHIEELFGFVPEAFAAHVGGLRRRLDESGDGLLAEMRRSDTENYMPGAVLPKVDRMSMQCSLEVRTPFLNMELARFAERLPPHLLVDGLRGKLLLKEVAYRYLPRELIDLPKQGFGLPMSDWARTSMLEVAGGLLESDDSRLRAMFGSAGVGRFLGRQRTEGRFAPYQVWGVAMLESWLRHHPVELPERSAGMGGPSGIMSAQSGSAEPEPEEAAATGPERLVAFPIGSGIFVAWRDRRPPGATTTSARVLARMPGELRVLLLELAADVSLEAETDDALPLIELASAAGRLRGGTILFSDGVAGGLSPGDWDGLVASGVRRVLARDPHRPGMMAEFELSGGGRMRRLLALARLFPKRSVLATNRRLPGWLGAVPHEFHPALTMQATPALPAIDPDRDRDLSDRYAMFDGLRHWPPLRSTHDEIRRAGGRYSLWNRQLFFGERGDGGSSGIYWLVRVDDETRRHLPITRRDRPVSRFDPVRKSNVLRGLVETPVAEPFRLTPGDPVAVCTHALPPGGAERQWVYLAQDLKACGYDVTFVVMDAPEPGNHYASLLQASGIPILACSRFGEMEKLRLWPKDAPVALNELLALPAPAYALSLVAALATLKPKALFLQLDQPNTVGGIAAHVAGVQRVVLSFRNYNPTNFSYLANDWFQPIYGMLAGSGRVVLTGNHADANDDYADWIGIDRAQVTFIPNAIDPVAFPLPSAEETAACRSSLGIAPDAPVVVGAFRLTSQKDPIVFIDVCAGIVAKVPEARILIAGVGPMEDEIRGRIAEKGLEGHVRLLGKRDDVNVLMRTASVFLFTSVLEGMPNVLMEAQLMGTPAVATEIGGVSAVVRDGETGLLCPVGAVAELTEASLRLLEDPALARRMGEAGRARMLADFPKTKLGERYLAALRGEAGTAQAPRLPAVARAG